MKATTSTGAVKSSDTTRKPGNGAGYDVEPPTEQTLPASPLLPGGPSSSTTQAPDCSPSLLWADLDKNQVELLNEARQDPQQILQMICGFLEIKHYKDNPRSRIFVDFCFYNIMFSIFEAKLNTKQTSVFYSLMKRIFEAAMGLASVASLRLPCVVEQVETTRQLQRDESYHIFKACMLQYGTVSSPEQPEKIFDSLAQIKTVGSFVMTTFFAHYLAYQYIYTHRPQTEVEARFLTIETPFEPPCLDEAEVEESNANSQTS